MLDSLVRVSRRVGGAADLLATETQPAQETVLAIRGRPLTRRLRSPERGAGTQASPSSNFTHVRGAPPAVRRAKHRRSAAAEPSQPERRVLADPIRPGRQALNLNLRCQLRETPPFTTAQFHALLNSLFKVLFNFPSRYLFAIGLGVIFSLTWSLPRTLSCTPKQLDSGEKPSRRADRPTGLSPSLSNGPCQDGLGQALSPR